MQNRTFFLWTLMCFLGVSVYSWGTPKCAGTHNYGITKENIFVSLQSGFLPLSTLHFPVAWWHSGETNSRTGLLFFVVGFNLLTGSCTFLKTSSFLNRKLWGGRWEQVSITSQILPTCDTEMEIYLRKVYDVKIKIKGFINSNVKSIITRKLG